MADQFLKSLELGEPLRHRILCRVSPAESAIEKKSFILYLPTVVLRRRHNPAFALACRLANHHQVPVVVLCTVLDDRHLSREPLSPIAMTARRLAFTLEALQDCAKEWEEHGAGVAIRLHGPGARNPHHLTLAHRAMAVVSDEPFVEPFRTYIRKVTIACQSAKVPCFSVDGSTTVPPKFNLSLSTNQPIVGDFFFQGAPGKAWIWEKQTNPNRKPQVHGAVRDGYFDAPELNIKLPKDFFLQGHGSNANSNHIVDSLVSAWNKPNLCGPGQRPWAVSELLAVVDVKDWVMNSWPGADTSIPPCRQTNGSSSSARERWVFFRDNQLKSYAKKRNQIVDPHAVSRISCYLNLGILSIFDVVHDVWQVMATRTGYSDGARKFLDEVVKWREIGYVHSFASPNYHTAQAIPRWAYDYLERQKEQSSRNGHTYERLESAATGDTTWDAMQQYLIETGELHNNARMTWGKTVVHWQASKTCPEDVLWQLCCLNDRFALDGLSPPSYAGILWCFGWCDKPASGGSVSTKWAHRYRKGPCGFEEAKERLYEQPSNKAATTAKNNYSTSATKKPRLEGATNPVNKSKSPTLLSFFAPVAKNP